MTKMQRNILKDLLEAVTDAGNGVKWAEYAVNDISERIRDSDLAWKIFQHSSDKVRASIIRDELDKDE